MRPASVCCQGLCFAIAAPKSVLVLKPASDACSSGQGCTANHAVSVCAKLRTKGKMAVSAELGWGPQSQTCQPWLKCDSSLCSQTQGLRQPKATSGHGRAWSELWSGIASAALMRLNGLRPVWRRKFVHPADSKPRVAVSSNVLNRRWASLAQPGLGLGQHLHPHA